MDIIVNGLKDFFSNYMLVSALLGWFSAQIIKILTGVFKEERISLKMLFSTGGMPSSHSASVIALTTAAAFEYGLSSSWFAVCAVISMVVMIDASGVRYETGKQAMLLNRITREIFSGNPELTNSGLKELVGHTPFQVFVGALLGLAVGVAMSFVMI